MFKVFTKKNSEYSKFERVCTATFSFIAFGIVGAVVRLLTGPTSLGSESELFFQYAPHVFGFAIAAAILGYIFPKVFNILLCFIPIPGASS